MAKAASAFPKGLGEMIDCCYARVRRGTCGASAAIAAA